MLTWRVFAETVTFVNDIPSVVSSPTFMFADDMKIFHFVRSSDDHATLQNDLNVLLEWSVRWQLKFNISLSVSMYTLDQFINLDHIT